MPKGKHHEAVAEVPAGVIKDNKPSVALTAEPAWPSGMRADHSPQPADDYATTHG